MQQIQPFKNEGDLKLALSGEYRKQIENYFGDPRRALEFLSSVMAAVQRTPKLLECQPATVINSFIMMAQLKLMPSGVSGEAYVLPYNNKGAMQAQFQLGYQGLVTLFFRAGIKSIVAEIVYAADTFSYANNEVRHEFDPFNDDRGEARGAYVVLELPSGSKIAKAMSKKEILGIGKKFSKSFSSNFTPWNEENDPQLWMWKKTVLKQCAKLVPKNEAINMAIAEDNKDSNINDRLEAARAESEGLRIGNLLESQNESHEETKDQTKKPDGKKGGAKKATGGAPTGAAPCNENGEVPAGVEIPA